MNDTTWFSWMLDKDWFYAGVLLIGVFPVLVIALGELIQGLPERKSLWKPILKSFQHQIVPQLVFLLILTQILGLDRSHFIVKVVETFLWVFVINTALSIVNVLLFANSGGRDDWRRKVPKLVLDVVRAFLVILGAALVLAYVWDLPLGKLLAALGVGSIVLGLALQDTLSALFSGFALLTSRQFQLGDWLSLTDNRIGKVISMNWRSVTLLTRDEDVIIVPNSDLAKSSFTNFSHPYPRHMERIPFDFSFDDAPHKVKDALLEAALSTPGILSDPHPRVALLSYDEFSVRHEVQYFIEHYSDQPAIRDSFMSRIWYVAKRHGITFPTRAHEVTMMPSPADAANAPQGVDVDLLKSFSFLKSRGAGLEDIARDSRLLEYGKGEVILRQGSISSVLFLVQSGTAEETYIDKNNQFHRLDILSIGDFFGLSSLIRQEESDLSVTALTDVTVIAIPETATQRLMDRFPDLANEMERIIEMRLRKIDGLEARYNSSRQDELEATQQNNVVEIKNFANK